MLDLITLLPSTTPIVNTPVQLSQRRILTDNSTHFKDVAGGAQSVNENLKSRACRPFLRLDRWARPSPHQANSTPTIFLAASSGRACLCLHVFPGAETVGGSVEPCPGCC